MKDADIDNNNNSSEEDEEEKDTVGIEFTDQKVDPENNENAFSFRWSNIRGKMRKTLLRITRLRDYKSKLIKFFTKE